MGETTINRAANIKEGVLQRHFEKWGDKRGQRAGAPAWMERIQTWHKLSVEPSPARDDLNAPDWLDSFGFVKTQMDAIGTNGDRNFVAELKYLTKGETNDINHDHLCTALPQALHHARALPRMGCFSSIEKVDCWTEGRPVVAVTVTPWNEFVMHSVSLLREWGVSDELLRVVSVVILEPEKEPNTEDSRLFWFFEELCPSRWVKVKPDQVPEKIRPQKDAHLEWYFDEGAIAYRGVPSGLDPEEPEPPKQYIEAARLGTEKTETWLVRYYKQPYEGGQFKIL